MGKKFFVEILIDELAPGTFPVYEAEADEEWYFLDEDGKTWKAFQGKKFHAPEFELAGPTQASVIRQVERAVVTICQLQEHGGTAILAIRCFQHIMQPVDVWSLEGSLLISQRSAREIGVVGSKRYPGVPPHMEIDEFSMEHLDRMEAVEELHER